MYEFIFALRKNFLILGIPQLITAKYHPYINLLRGRKRGDYLQLLTLEREVAMRGNKAFVNDNGVIEAVVSGDQTVATMQALGDQVVILGGQARKAGKPVLVLDNLYNMGEMPTEATKRAVEIIKSGDFDRRAFVGSGGVLRIGANLILHATGKPGKVKYFDDYEKATSWLRTGLSTNRIEAA